MVILFHIFYVVFLVIQQKTIICNQRVVSLKFFIPHKTLWLFYHVFHIVCFALSTKNRLYLHGIVFDIFDISQNIMVILFHIFHFVFLVYQQNIVYK